MAKDFTQTRLFNSEEIKREVIHSNLMTVSQALDERGYNAVHQIAGYLISNDPAIFLAIKVLVQLFNKLIVMKLLRN